jgi:hypothetical protein
MTGRPIPELASAAREVLSVLDEAGVPACLIGGLVVQRWGQPRATTDIDFTVLAPYGDEGRVLDVLLKHFAPRRPDARAFALASRVVLLVTTTGVSVDIALGAFGFELEALEQSSDWEAVPGLHLRTCAAEHLVVYKLVAARPQDLIDVEGVVRRQAGRLDVESIRRWGRVFAELKEDPDLLRPFEEVLRKIAR